MATKFYEAVEELVDLFEPHFPIGRQKVKRFYGRAYTRILRRFPWRELLSDWIEFTWDEGRSFDPTSVVDGWWGRPATIRADSDTGNWKPTDEVELSDIQGAFDGGGGAIGDRFVFRRGRRLFAISAKGWKLNVVDDLTSELIHMKHYADPGALIDETDELAIEDDYATFKAVTAIDIWRSSQQGLKGALPVFLNEMNVEAQVHLEEMVIAAREAEGVEMDIMPDPVLSAYARQQQYERGAGYSQRGYGYRGGYGYGYY